MWLLSTSRSADWSMQGSKPQSLEIWQYVKSSSIKLWEVGILFFFYLCNSSKSEFISGNKWGTQVVQIWVWNDLGNDKIFHSSSITIHAAHGHQSNDSIRTYLNFPQYFGYVLLTSGWWLLDSKSERTFWKIQLIIIWLP